VQRAVHAGLVHRTTSADDGRVVHLSLTPAGEEKLARVHDALGRERTALRHVVDQLSG
jgi:DNA-binding MarR family transcriptional regulator